MFFAAWNLYTCKSEWWEWSILWADLISYFNVWLAQRDGVSPQSMICQFRHNGIHGFGKLGISNRFLILNSVEGWRILSIQRLLDTGNGGFTFYLIPHYLHVSAVVFTDEWIRQFDCFNWKVWLLTYLRGKCNIRHCILPLTTRDMHWAFSSDTY